MTAASLALQEAVYAALSVDAALATLLGRPNADPADNGVFDHVPEKTAFPYVTIGDDTQADWSDKEVDGEEHTLTLHAWSRHRGRRQVKQILGRLKALLHKQTLAMAGHDSVLIRFDFELTMLDPDGKTYHGAIRFRALTRTA